MGQELHYYAGIGSRQTPENIQKVMHDFAAYAEEHNLVLRSGAAQGADQAFESGVHSKHMMQIFIPWRGFTNQPHHRWQWASRELEKQAQELASQFHPNWAACSRGARALHARNMAQILGPHLDLPVKFVACWTPNASGSGGTGQALRIAKELDIPIFDFGGDWKRTVRVAHELKSFVDAL